MIRVDRIEGEVAVVEIGDQTVDISLELLPEGVEEGATLALVLADAAASAGARERAAERIRRLAARSQLPDEIEL